MDGVSGVLLGGIHRLVGQPQKRLPLGSVGGVDGNADAYRRLDTLFLDEENSALDVLANALADLRGAFLAGILQDDHELVAAVAKHRINIANGVLNRLPDGHEKLAADLVAVAIVDAL